MNRRSLSTYCVPSRVQSTLYASSHLNKCDEIEARRSLTIHPKSQIHKVDQSGFAPRAEVLHPHSLLPLILSISHKSRSMESHRKCFHTSRNPLRIRIGPDFGNLSSRRANLSWDAPHLTAHLSNRQMFKVPADARELLSKANAQESLGLCPSCPHASTALSTALHTS